jgi:hypothetical protein
LRASDVIAVLMNVPGVKAVHRLALDDRTPDESWYVPLDAQKTPRLDSKGSRISLHRGSVRFTAPAEAALPPEPSGRVLSDVDRDRPVPRGRNRRVESYRSLQHDLPQAFGVGSAGLAADASPERRARARQLAAYLALFDQVLASSFSQLAHAGDLLSPEVGATYFPRLATDAPRWREVFTQGDSGPLDPSAHQDVSARRQRFLDHLLARFAEDARDFGWMGADGRGELTVAQRQDNAHAQDRATPEVLWLRNYAELSGGRARGYDYTRPSWDERHADNISGLEKRIALRLGLTRYYRRPLGKAAQDEPGFHLIEHLLLRPGSADNSSSDLEWREPAFLGRPLRRDPYSAQLTFVFPDWIQTSGNDAAEEEKEDYQRRVETTVRQETPAHLSVRVLWLDRERMARFDEAYRVWLEARVESP